jgi:peptidoglycan/xylan/chitin deacetylase (PgdA/CDA1 family)
MFDVDDLPSLLDLGHELGCHTFEHSPAWETSPARFEADVIRNTAALKKHAPGAEFRTHSYPISYPQPETKHRVEQYFDCCRGCGQTFNWATIDLNYLAAFFIEQDAHRPEFIRETIIENQRAGGWLIFATHDVCANPSRFGCTPELFRDVVRFAFETGAEILPVAKALKTIQGRAHSQS